LEKKIKIKNCSYVCTYVDNNRKIGVTVVFFLQALLLYTLPLIFMCVAYYHIVRTLWRRNNIPGSQETTDGAGSGHQRLSNSTAGLANANSASAVSLASTPGGATTPPVSAGSQSRLSILSR
jgi:hypothetical protein